MSTYDLTNKYLGQYHITEIISYGGTSTVYKAYQASLDRSVAVKVLIYNRDPQFASRFKREARLIAQLQHPNIMPIYEYGEHAGMLYLVLRYIEQGATLDGQLGAPMEPVKALRLTSMLLSALDYAHARGIIHRDVKPANVLMPAPDWPLLADFGIAKFTQDDLRLTSTGLIIGTAAYMSPEQATGEPLDARSDVYSTGVLLYEMLTGQVPFDGSSAMALLHKHVHAPPPALHSLVPGMPPQVEGAVLRALAKEPDARYQSAAEMAEALEQIAAQLERGVSPDVAVAPTAPVVAPPVPARKRAAARLPGEDASRSSWRSWSTFLIAAALIGGGTGLGWLGVQNAGAQLPETPTSAALLNMRAPSQPPATDTASLPTSAPAPSATLAPTDIPAPTIDIAAAKAATAAVRADDRAALLQARADATTAAAATGEAQAQANAQATATVEAQAAARATAAARAQAAAAATARARAAAATAQAIANRPRPTAVPTAVPPPPPTAVPTAVPPTAVPIIPTAPPAPEPPTPEPTKKRGGGGGGGGGGGEPAPPPEKPPPPKDG